MFYVEDGCFKTGKYKTCLSFVLFIIPQEFVHDFGAISGNLQRQWTFRWRGEFKPLTGSSYFMPLAQTQLP